MRRNIPWLFILLATITLNLMGTDFSYASLGQPKSSIDDDQANLRSETRTSTTQNNYTVEELKTPNGTIREYVSPSGVVFAIVWKKSFNRPNLEVLLGSNYQGYLNTKAQSPRNRGRAKSITKWDGIVVQTSGHQRSMGGLAYVTSLIPSGVTINEIQ